MFLSQLSLNGVLSIACDQRILTLAFKDGFLLDGQSLKADEKILRVLRFRKHIDMAQERQIRQIRSETGMPVRHILAELNFLQLSDIKNTLELGIHEVLLELFLLETGTFHFTDTTVDADTAGIKLGAGALAITVLSQADEFRNFEKTIVTLDRAVHQKLPAGSLEGMPLEERVLTHMTAQPIRVGHLIATAPLGSYQTMQLIEQQLATGTLCLCEVPDSLEQPRKTPPAIDPLFAAYKQTLRMLISADEVLKKLEAIIAFCKNYYDGILILTARGTRLIHCKVITLDAQRSIRQQSFKGDLGGIDQDPLFQAVQRSRIGFFGKLFPSTLIERMVKIPIDGECALLPVLSSPHLSMFCYVYTERAYSGISPHHYLELLSWILAPIDKSALARPSTEASSGPSGGSCPYQGKIPQADGLKDNMARLVAHIDDLPPFPALAARTLEMLADPNASMEEVEKTIAQDQAMIAKMIKVSNSVLYGGYQKVATLRQALTRLGAKTTKSLVLASSTRGYFFKNRNAMKTYGQFLWQHAIETGMAARRIAEACGHEDPEQAFVAGIMHDIGKLVILMIDDKKYKEIQQLKVIEKLSTLEAETEVLGMDHAALGRLLMEKWHMPEAVQVCTQFHHRHTDAPQFGPLTAVVAYGNYLSNTLGSHPLNDHLEDEPLAHALQAIIGLNASSHELLKANILADFQNSEIVGES
jgi:HD-like signal output (HDOD) protein